MSVLILPFFLLHLSMLETTLSAGGSETHLTASFNSPFHNLEFDFQKGGGAGAPLYIIDPPLS